MNEQTLRPYRVRRTETEQTAVEWDMRRDPLSPEVLTQLFTYGATEEINVGFDCFERIVLAADESGAKNGVITDLSKAQANSENPDYKRMYELMQDRENMMYEIKRLKSNLGELTRTYNEKVNLVVKLRQALQSRIEKINKIQAIIDDKEVSHE